MRKILTLMFLCSLLTLHSLGFAANRAGAYTLTLADGYEFFSSAHHIRNSGVPNLALAYNFTEQWAVEALVGNINTVQRSHTDQGVHGWLYLLDGVYRLTPRNYFAPYILAGVGDTSLKPNGVDPVNQANINIGIGTQLFADTSIAARIEARDIYTMNGGKNDVMVNGGVSFLFG